MSEVQTTEEWVDCDNYWLNIHTQGSEGWKSARREGWGDEKLITASNFGKVILDYDKHGNRIHHDAFCTREQYMEIFVTGIEKEVSKEGKRHMKRGNDYEPLARLIYEKVQGCKVLEVGLAVPKFNVSIGGSVDGMVGKNGLIEIKCPENVYYRLKDLSKTQKERIFKSHYAQMQGCMAITGREWCDYVVYGVVSGEHRIERVHFDVKYWENILHPSLCSFVSESKELRMKMNPS